MHDAFFSEIEEKTQPLSDFWKYVVIGLYSRWMDDHRVAARTRSQYMLVVVLSISNLFIQTQVWRKRSWRFVVVREHHSELFVCSNKKIL